MIIAFLFGDWLLQQFQDLPGPWVSLLLVAVIPVIWWWQVRPVRWVICMALGFLWAWYQGYTMLMERLPNEWEGRDVVVDGRIASIPRVFERGTQFDLDTLTLTVNGKIEPWRRKIRLFWYNQDRKTVPSIMVGERWSLAVRLQRPHGLMNPGGFDREGQLFRNGISALGYIRAIPSTVRIDTGNWRYIVDGLRQHLALDIARARPNSPYLGLIQGLAIGETSAITPAQWATLTSTGTIHLLAISGSHIVLVAGLAYFVVHHLWVWAWSAALWFAAPRAGAVAAIVVAVIYAALAGFPVSAQRAVMMVSIPMIALIIGRVSQPTRILRQALLIILLWDPLAVTSTGFWLSFGAVVIIFQAILIGRTRRLPYWLSFVRMQWGITIGLTPILLVFFQRIVVYSPLANLIAIPWVELVTVPAVLAGTLLISVAPCLVNGLLAWADLALMGLWLVLEFIAALPGANWSPTTPPVWVVIVAILGAWLLLAPRGLPGRWLGLIGMAPLFMLPLPKPLPGELWVTVLDVGQGLATVVRTTTHTLVYDTGPRFDGYDAGTMVLVPFLRYVGRLRVDTLLVSHADGDHSGGAAALLAALPDKPRLLGAVPGGELCQRGITWNWDGIDFRVIHPSVGSTFTGNDASCVLRITWAGGALLLTGDIGHAAEAQLVAATPEDLRATVIVAPHHGSKKSSTPAFIAAVAPQLVIYTTGYRNRFNFPHPEVVARYAAVGAQTFDTARHGALELHLGRGLSDTVCSWRADTRHYWNLTD